MEQKLVALSGNEAVAYAFKQARPHVAAAFPITPQTEMMHKYAEFVANGESETEMILVESEHSAMSARWDRRLPVRARSPPPAAPASPSCGKWSTSPLRCGCPSAWPW